MKENVGITKENSSNLFIFRQQLGSIFCEYVGSNLLVALRDFEMKNYTDEWVHVKIKSLTKKKSLIVGVFSKAPTKIQKTVVAIGGVFTSVNKMPTKDLYWKFDAA